MRKKLVITSILISLLFAQTISAVSVSENEIIPEETVLEDTIELENETISMDDDSDDDSDDENESNIPTGAC